MYQAYAGKRFSSARYPSARREPPVLRRALRLAAGLSLSLPLAVTAPGLGAVAASVPSSPPSPSSLSSPPSGSTSLGTRATHLLASIPTLGVLTPSRIAGDVPASSGTPWTTHRLTVTLILRRAGALPQAPAKGVELPARLAVASVAPPASVYAHVVQYLRKGGLAITHLDSGHLMLQASGTVSAMDRVFHARIDAYAPKRSGRGTKGRTGTLVYGPRASARLPKALTPYVAGVFGLSSFSLPTPAPLSALPVLRSAATPSPGVAGPAVQADKAPLPNAVPLATFTMSFTHPSYAPVPGLETDVTVSLRSAQGTPLAGYTIEPVVPTGVSLFQGPTGPHAMVTNAKGQAGFWVLSGVPQSLELTALALPPNSQATTTGSGASSGGTVTPSKAATQGLSPGSSYLTAAGLPVSFSGPAVSLTPYTAAQINGAYGISPLLAAGDTGHGVGIGIVIWNRFSLSDVRQYMASQGIPMPHVRVVTVDGPLQSGSGGTEATLDVERSGATAPGANITVWDAGTASGVITALVDAIEAGNDQVLSLSWGISEADLPDNAMDPLEVLFDAAAQEGMTVAVASGDTGSYGNGTQLGVGWPTSSPMVLSVGGTEMAVGLGRHTIAQEAAWSPDGSFSLGGGVSAPSASGGGYSRYYPRPVWQVGPGLPPIWKIPFRGVPDVSLAATYPGYATIVNGKSTAYGGTSAATPTWAGMIADIDSGLGLDLGPEVMPLLYAFAAGVDPSVFRTLTEGTNGFYTVHPGWNPVTGLGTPNAEALFQAFRSTYTPAQIEAILPTPGILMAQTPVTLAVAVVDSSGIPLGGVPVTALAPAGGQVRPGNTQTGTNGVVTFTITAEQPGIHTFTFQVSAHAGPTGAGKALVAQWTGNFQPVSVHIPKRKSAGHGSAVRHH